MLELIIIRGLCRSFGQWGIIFAIINGSHHADVKGSNIVQRLSVNLIEISIYSILIEYLKLVYEFDCHYI